MSVVVNIADEYCNVNRFFLKHIIGLFLTISMKRGIILDTKKSIFNDRSDNMIAVKQVDIKANIKKYFDMVFQGEQIIVPRKRNENVIVISEQEYNELQQIKRNVEYMKMINKSMKEAKDGNFITKSIEELEEMTDENQ